MLPVSLDCPFLIVLSVFSNVYVKEAGTTYHSRESGSTPCLLRGPHVALVLVLRSVFYSVSLDCPYLTTPSVFSKFRLTFYSKTQLEETKKHNSTEVELINMS